MQKRTVSKQVVRYREDVSVNFVSGSVRMRRTAFSLLTLDCGHEVQRPGARTFKSATCKLCPQGAPKPEHDYATCSGCNPDVPRTDR